MSTAHFVAYLALELIAFGIIAIAIIFGALLVWDYIADWVLGRFR